MMTNRNLPEVVVTEAIIACCHRQRPHLRRLDRALAPPTEGDYNYRR